MQICTSPQTDNHANTPPRKIIFDGSSAKQNILISHTQQPFYGSLDLVWDNPGELVPEGTFRHLLDFLEQNEDNTGRRTNNLDGLLPHQD